MRRLRQLSYHLSRAGHDQLAMQQLNRFPGAYLPWSSFAMRPSGVVEILNDIVINDRRTIVECGPGVSTVFIARLLREREGRLHSIEHDPDWAALVQGWLDAEGLADRVSMVVAPLRDADGWYDPEPLSRIRSETPIDLLIVDGPPAYTQELRHARYPALPFFRAALAPGVTVVLDDIARQGEREVVARWEAEFGMTFEQRPEEAGIAISSGSGFKTA